MRVVGLLSAICATFPIVAYGCAGDHDRLKKVDPVGGEGGTGGAGGDTSTTTSGGGGGAGGIQEPPGAPALTIVNGTVDEAAIRLCFVPYPGGANTQMPWPEGARLDYAHHAVVSIDEVIPAATDVELVVVAGSFANTDGSSCKDLIDDTPTGVLLRSVGILPESVFTTEKSVLIATAGCVGGRDHEHPNQEFICGAGYSVDRPTATVVAGFVSRLTNSSKLPLQFVQASLGVTDVQVRIKPGNGGASQQVVDAWSFGAIQPYPPNMSVAADQLGNVSQTSIELYTNGATAPLASTVWAQAFNNSTLSADDVANGVGLAFVAVGPVPTFDAGAWWNGFTYAVLLADPP